MTDHAQRTGTPSVVVIGGGLAGIAAALALARRKLPVTLVETRKHLGGRATSFTDPATGQILDNCQHVLMGCCTNLRHLYGQLGVSKLIRWQRRMYFAGFNRAGRAVIDVLEANDLPAPLHMAAALLRFRSLTPGEKLAIARGLLAMIRLGTTGRASWHTRTFNQWLIDHGQPRGAVEKFWSLIVVSALNERPQRVAADHAIQVFQEGFLSHQEAHLMGLSAAPLVQLYDAAEPVIATAGGQVMLSTSVEGLVLKDGQIRSLQIGGRQLVADAFVSAVPFDRLRKMCPSALLDADARLQGLDRIQVSPILGIHLWFEVRGQQPVMALPNLILTHSPLQWIFNKGMQAFKDLELTPEELAAPVTAQGPVNTAERTVQHLHGVISAAHDVVDWPADRIKAMAVAEVRKALPDATQAQLVHGRVIKEKRATFSAAPGTDVLRPEARGAIPNFYLAGDWCRNGWPATMEGAVRSGYLAAAAVLDDHHHSVDPPIADLAPSRLYRLLSRGFGVGAIPG